MCTGAKISAFSCHTPSSASLHSLRHAQSRYYIRVRQNDVKLICPPSIDLTHVSSYTFLIVLDSCSGVYLASVFSDCTLDGIMDRRWTLWPDYLNLGLSLDACTVCSGASKPNLSILQITGISQFSSLTQLCPTLCDPMNCNTPGLPIHHQLPELLKLLSTESWCHPTISSSVCPFSSHLQSLPASGSFQMSQLFASGGQSIGV